MQGCTLTNTGRNDTLRGQGEGVYVGSAYHFGEDFTANTRVSKHVYPPCALYYPRSEFLFEE